MFAVISRIISILLFICSGLAFAAPISNLLCREPGYNCYVIKRGETWQRLFHNPQQMDLVMRLNRMNTSLHRGMKIAVPNNLSDTNIMDYAPLPTQINPPGEKVIYVSVNPKVLAWGAYDAQGMLQA